MRMAVMLNHHLFHQLPYRVRWDSRQFYQNVQIEFEGRWLSAEEWAHHPSRDINVATESEAVVEAAAEEDHINYPPSSQYPSRPTVMNRFVETFVKYGRAIPDVAIKGVLRDLPVSLRPAVNNISVLRPTHLPRHSEYRCVHDSPIY